VVHVLANGLEKISCGFSCSNSAALRWKIAFKCRVFSVAISTYQIKILFLPDPLPLIVCPHCERTVKLMSPGSRMGRYASDAYLSISSSPVVSLPVSLVNGKWQEILDFPHCCFPFSMGL
jgi:hypothetical protein